MGQIVDKAASLCQSNELGPPRTISNDRHTYTRAQLWQLYDGNFQIIMSTYFFRSHHKYLPGEMSVCRDNVLIRAHERPRVYTCMLV